MKSGNLSGSKFAILTHSMFVNMEVFQVRVVQEHARIDVDGTLSFSLCAYWPVRVNESPKIRS